MAFFLTLQLLAVSGPFHYWGPVVDGQYLRELPSRRLKRPLPVKVDLLIGGSQDDGLINRAKAVKVGKGRPLQPPAGILSQELLTILLADGGLCTKDTGAGR